MNRPSISIWHLRKTDGLALELARDKDQPTMTSPINLVQGGKGFLIYFPIFINKEFQGFVSAVFKVDHWLRYVFSLPEIIKERENFSSHRSI